MSHWSEIVRAILEEKTGDLKKLARIAGCSPEEFYSHQSLAGCDLRGQDLSGIDLTGCDIENSIFDEYTIIDDRFEFRPSNEWPQYITILIPKSIDFAIGKFSDYYNYVYRAWAYKNLLNRFRRSWDTGRINTYISSIENSPELKRVSSREHGEETVEVTVLINKLQFDAMREAEVAYPQFDPENLAFVSSLIMARAPYSQVRKKSPLPMEVLWGLEGA